MRIKDKEASIVASVEAVVNSVTTERKLLKVWPEAKELLPKASEIAQKANLPALRIEELNSIVGLPSKN